MDPRTGMLPKRSIFFYPDQPPFNDMLEYVRRCVGWDLAISPETADWCVLFRNATYVSLPDDDPFAGIAPTWINGRCRDISKRTVQRVFAEVFGYPLAIDPLTHQGLCVRKSNLNAISVNGVKDVMVLACPIPVDELSDQYVYERLVDGLVPGLGRIELTPVVVGGTVVSVGRAIRSDWINLGRFAEESLDFMLVYPNSVFSHQELKQIEDFCEAMGLDFGKLDIIREREDQRIYILDANKTPQIDPRASGARRLVFNFRLEQLAQALPERYPPRSAILAPAGPVVIPHGTHAPPDEAGSLAAQMEALMEAQMERIGRLEVEVGKLGAEIARVRAANGIVSPGSGKQKRKK